MARKHNSGEDSSNSKVLFLTQRNRPKQGADRAEQAQAIGDGYATVANCWDEYVSLVEGAIFEYAFHHGAQLAMRLRTDEE